MKLSIIVPVYKVEKYLNRCVDSILEQKFTDFELILVDDGSPDGCPEICNEYLRKDERVKVIHKINGGLRSAIICGVKESKGEYLGFVDSDDWIEPEMYASMMSLIDKYSLDCVICNYKYVYENTGKMESVDFGIREGLFEGDTLNEFYDGLLPSMSKNTYIAGSRCNKVFKREKLYDYIVYADSSVTIAEDTMVTHMALLNCEKIYYIKKDYYNYRKNNTSIMSQYKENYFEDWWKTTEIYRPYADKFTNALLIQEAKYWFLVNNVLRFIVRSDYKIGEKYLLLKKVACDSRTKEVLESVKSIKKTGKFDMWYFVVTHRLIFPMLIYSQLMINLRKLKRKMLK